MLRGYMLPGEKEPLKFRQRSRLNFRAQTVDRQPVNAGQQTPVAPFDLTRVRVKFAAQNKSFAFQRQQRQFDFVDWKSQPS